MDRYSFIDLCSSYCRCQLRDNTGYICIAGFEISCSDSGFFEVLIWLMAIGQIMQNLSNPVCFIAYSAGFAMGNFVGMCIAEKLSLGFVMVRVITVKKASELVRRLRSAEYGVTNIDGHGSEGTIHLINYIRIVVFLRILKINLSFTLLKPNIG